LVNVLVSLIGIAALSVEPAPRSAAAPAAKEAARASRRLKVICFMSDTL
jgi:hypothetical protein